MTTFDPGSFRHRLSWQTLDQSAVNALNQPANTWTTQGTFWGRVEPLGGMELMNARQVKATTSHKVTMRAVGGDQGLRPAHLRGDGAGLRYRRRLPGGREERLSLDPCDPTEGPPMKGRDTAKQVRVTGADGLRKALGLFPKKLQGKVLRRSACAGRRPSPPR